MVGRTAIDSQADRFTQRFYGWRCKYETAWYPIYTCVSEALLARPSVSG